MTVCFPFVGDAVGGSHISAAGLIRGLEGTRYRPLVVLHDTGGPLAPWLEAQDIPFAVLPRDALLDPAPGRFALPAAASLFVVRRLRGLVRFLADNGVGIVHTNDGRIHATWCLAARAGGARLVWHHRGDPTARGVNTLAPLLADRVVTVSRFARPAKPVRPLGRRLSVVFSPFDHPRAWPDRDAARRAIAAELGCPPETRFVGCFGYLIERKRPDFFVEIVQTYARLHPDAPVHGLIVGQSMPGDGRVEEAARRKIADGAFRGVHLLGFRSPVEPLMGGIDALVVPAVNEPFGRTLIEAMMLGTPVVAAAHGGNLEAIDDGRTGFLVPPDDAEAFAHVLRRLVSDPQLWRSVSEAAQREALQRFSPEAHVASIVALYDELFGERGSRKIP